MTDNIFEAVKASVTMSQVAEMCGYKPDRAGRILCPFHHEKTPSMKIYGGNRGFYCYGCQAGGDVVKFTQKVFECSAIDAAKKIAEHFGIDCGVSSPSRAMRRGIAALRQRTAEEKKQTEIKRLNQFIQCVNRVPIPEDDGAAALHGKMLGRREYVEYVLGHANEFSLNDLKSVVPEFKGRLEIDELSGEEFEDFCASSLFLCGYSGIEFTPRTGDQGIDILAYRDGVKFGFQCKRYSSDVGNKAVQEAVAGKLFYGCHVAVVIASGSFTKSAKDLAEKIGVVLLGKDYVEKMLREALCREEAQT